MSEISDVVQIVRVEFEGIQLAVKVAGSSMHMVKKMVEFLASLLEHEKSIGKTNLKKMLLKGGDLQVFQFDKEQEKEVKKLCKKYGVLFTEVPSKKDSKRMEILFHSEATPRVNMLIQKMKNPATAQIKSVDSFIKEEEKGKQTDKERNGERDAFFQEAREGLDQKEDLSQEISEGMGRKHTLSPEMEEAEKRELTIWEKYLKQFDEDEKPNLAPPVQMAHSVQPEKRKSR